MDIMCYVLASLCVVMGLFTAVLYNMNKPREAFVTKMIASSLFLCTGAVSMSQARFNAEVGALVVMGMVLSLWGDYFLAKKEVAKLGSSNNFAFGVYSFAGAQILFVTAFLWLADWEFNYYFLFLLLLGIVPLLVGKLTKMFTFHGKELWLSMLYGTLLCLTLAVTASTYMLEGSDTALVAMIGAICFVISDFSLGLYYFTSWKKRKLFNYPIMFFYFAAEVLYAIALVM